MAGSLAQGTIGAETYYVVMWKSLSPNRLYFHSGAARADCAGCCCGCVGRWQSYSGNVRSRCRASCDNRVVGGRRCG